MNRNEFNTMFCRQCQETFGNAGCTKVGVCGKRPVTAGLMDDRLRAAVAEAERRLGRLPARKRPKAFGDADVNMRSLKELTLFGLKGIAAYCHHAAKTASYGDPSETHCMRGTVPDPRAAPWTFRSPVVSAISPSVTA